MIPIQAIRNAMVNDLVVRNVADLTAVLTGKAGRPSRSLNLEQALAAIALGPLVEGRGKTNGGQN